MFCFVIHRSFINTEKITSIQYIRIFERSESCELLGKTGLSLPKQDKIYPVFQTVKHGKHVPTRIHNTSFKTCFGFSLNDKLLTGPKLQADLSVVLTRWRFFRVAFTLDIVKMFRQIRVHPEDADWQRLVWRPYPSSELQDFRLATVTYGTACAPYLAIRTLQQQAADGGRRFPLGAVSTRRRLRTSEIGGRHSQPLLGGGPLEKNLDLDQEFSI